MTERAAARVSVVIPAKDAGRWIGEQLAALTAQRDAPAFEVVIGDNGSTDDTRSVAESFPAPFEVRVVDASDVPSASHARNVAAAAARGEILLFCDADDLVGDRWVRELHRAVMSHERVVARGVLEHARFNSPDVLAAYRVDPALDVREEQGTSVVTAVSGGFAGYLPTVPGCNFGIRRSDYLGVGGMDPRYPGGAEETDFVWRAQEAGLSVVQTGGAVVHYRLRQTPSEIFRQQRNQQRGRMYLWTRYRDRGMDGPSVKASLGEIARQIPSLPEARRDRRKGLAWAYTVGAHVGALEGMARYRWAFPERHVKRIPLVRGGRPS